MKRLLDVSVALLGIVVLSLPFAVLWVLVRATSPGPAIYWSDRVGRGNVVFRMPKFRSMRVGAPIVASHLLTDADSFITPMGRWLRRTSLDELPQLFSVLRGSMSLVGPRPALDSQCDLIEARTKAGVPALRPGVTGWAQINGRDELSVADKVSFDAWYLEHNSVRLDLRILLITVLRVAQRRGIAH